jgi:peptidoglycan hydrolase CwlO-like protein
MNIDNTKKTACHCQFIFLLLIICLAGSLLQPANVQAIPGTAIDGTAANSQTSQLSAEEKKKIEKKVDSIEDIIDDKQDEVESLDQKAQNYQRMIDLKKQQRTTLKNQLDMMNLQIENFNNSIALNKDQINSNLQEINNIQNKITEKEKDLTNFKNQLGEMIRAFNQIDQELMMEMLSSAGDMTPILNRSEYLDQASQKVSETLKTIEIKKQELSKEQAVYAEKNIQLKEKKMELEEKVYLLNNEKSSKDTLLAQTAGEEAKYQELLERVEAQKQELIGDIDALSDDKRSELAKIKASAPTPKDGKASTSWYFSQKDPRWGTNRIGMSSSLMKDYGCAVTSLAMVFTYHNQAITPAKLAQMPIFYRDLIVWPQYWKGLKMVGGHAHGNISWSTVDEQLKKKNPVVVFVKASAGKGHYVVIHGKDKKGGYIVHDPIFGANIYLETTKKLVGAIYGTKTTVDQMIIYNP